MSVITVPDALSDTLAAAAGPVELRAADGRRLGRFVPEPAPVPTDPPAAEAPAPDGTPAKPQTMADLFAGHIGLVGSGKPSDASVRAKELFGDYVVRKHREGRLWRSAIRAAWSPWSTKTTFITRGAWPPWRPCRVRRC